jgi:hypothetical protein
LLRKLEILDGEGSVMARSLVKLFIFLIVGFIPFLMVGLIPTDAGADARLYGTWVESESGQRIDILDGFEPGKGAVLILDSDGDVTIEEWKKETTIELTLGWTTNDVHFIDDNSFTWGDKTYKKQILDASDISTITLKDDPNTFVQILTSFEWITSLESQNAIFKITFSEDSGVIEFSKENKLEDLESWGISSGILKIGSNIIVEARVSERYFIGLNDSDDFIIFKSLKPASPMVSTDVKKDRDKFFNEFLTDEWVTTSWGSVSTHRFRPIYGELKGVQLTLDGDKHSGNDTWEYSPSTGALKIGYTEYIGAMVVNDTLALLEEDGSQDFFGRAPGGAGKRFTVTDVTKIPLNENSLEKIKSTLSGQFQNSDNLYQFEFNQDLRTGYLHRWKSDPFNITGETFSTELLSDSNSLYLSEDFVIFNDSGVFKRDISASRLQTKTDQEVLDDIEKQRELLDNSLNKSVLVRLIKIDGTIVDVALPVSTFGEISSLSLIIE